ncbi:DNA polymerase III subunit delta [uncultured Pseudoteredinibacter sp.]|uniref:DNA polymerase III subunit delta n=1 Tax=uncultured Pseudoteredinibacter sp. TaxID=1641701 RepID=UPI002628145A|nr:DNA polymerase III subunit delta [uncultured Pseudoteredinibacter sp.]
MAKLRAEQLQASLKKELKPVYIISGKEPLLAQEMADEVRAAARKQGFSEREVLHVDRSFDWNLLLDSANAMSLFAEKKIIELNIPGGKPGTEGSKALQQFCDNANDDNILLIQSGKLDQNQQRGKWFKAIEKLGHSVQVWPIKAAQLPHWIKQRLQQANLSADPQAIEILCARVEGNLLAAAQEIEKLKLLAEDHHISSELMNSVVANSARYDIFDLADKALMGDAQACTRTLQGLKSEGTDAIPVLWALAREIRSLNQIAHAQDQGQNFDWAAKSAGVWDKRKPLVAGALRRLNKAQLELLLRKANGIDKAAKGMRKADAWSELMDLCLCLCGQNSIHPSLQRLSLSL